MTKKTSDFWGDVLGTVSGTNQMKLADKNRRQADSMRAQDIAMRKEELEYARKIDAERMAMARENDDRMYGFSQEQFQHARSLDERNFQRANELDAYRRGLTSDMMRDARISPHEIEQRLGQSTGDVVSAFQKARAIKARNMGRMGVNPNSGRWSAMENEDTMNQAAAEAGARNSVRNTARAEGRELTQRARMAGLGLTDTSLALNNYQQQRNMTGGNETALGLNNHTIGSMGRVAGAYGNYAGMHNNNAMEYYKSGVEALTGTVNSGVKAVGYAMAM